MQQAGLYLRQIVTMKEEIRRLLARKEELASMAAGVSAIRYDREKVQTSPANTFEDRMINTISKAQQINQRITCLTREIKRRTDQIRGMRGKMRTVLYYRYVLEKSWNEICQRMGCSYKTIMQLHRRALIRFSQLYTSEM